MRKHLTALLAAFGLTLGIAVAVPSMASADQQFGCSTLSGHLHSTETRINYGSAVGSAIYVSATASYKQVLSLQPDVTWTFVKIDVQGLGTSYTQPHQWGSASAPLDFNTRLVTVTWKGRNNLGGTYGPKTCSVYVGAP